MTQRGERLSLGEKVLKRSGARMHTGEKSATTALLSSRLGKGVMAKLSKPTNKKIKNFSRSKYADLATLGAPAGLLAGGVAGVALGRKSKEGSFGDRVVNRERDF